MNRVLLPLICLVWPLLLEAAPLANSKKMPAAPLSFIENRGQIAGRDKTPRTDIDLKLKSRGMSVFIGDGQLHYLWKKKLQPTDPGSKMSSYRMDVELVGANKNAEIVKEEQQQYYENYYLPQCPDGITAHTYNKVTYKNIYPNIDWVLYASNNELKYDFVIRPGGKASDIKLRYKGATALNMKDGAVTAHTPFGSVTEKKPYTFDAVTKKEVPSSFILKSNELRFAVAASEHTVVIDPVLAWGTYYGESGQDDYPEGIATDDLGNVFFAGYTNSDDEIYDGGAFDPLFEGPLDAFLVKFNNDGARLWGTYFGTMGTEYCYDVVTDKSGNIFICGDSDEPAGLAFGAVHQGQNESAPGGKDAFIARFNNATGQRDWCSYYGGVADENAQRMAVDGFGEVYMTGMTRSNNLIHKAPGFKSIFGGGYSDGYVAKFSTSGTVVWATYLGGNLDDAGWSVAVDSNDYAFVAGETFSLDFYCTPDAELDTIIPHPTPPPPPAIGPPIVDPYNAFIVKFSPPGAVLYSSMYEGWDGVLGYSRPYDLSADSKGNIYMGTGKIVKFDNGGKFKWVKGTSGYRLRVDNEDYIYAAGQAFDSSGFSTPGSQQPNFAGGWDGFIQKYDTAGNKTWGTYYGGINNDKIRGLALDKRNRLFVCGNTASASGITTPGSHKDTWTGVFTSTDGFISKWHDTIAKIDPFVDTVICPPDTVTIAYTVEVIFGATNTFTAQLSDANGSFANPTNIGAFTSNNSGTIQGVLPATTPPGTGYRIRVVSSSPATITKDNGRNIRILERPKTAITGITQACTNDSIGITASSTVPGASIVWNVPGGPLQVGASVKFPHVADNNAGHYVVTVSNDGCSTTDSIDIIVHPRPYVVKLPELKPVCEGGTLSLDVEGDVANVTYKWVGPNGFISGAKSPLISDVKANTHTGLYYVFMTSNKGCVSDSNALNAEVVKLEANIKEIELKTPGDTIKLEGSANRDGVTWSWTGPDSFKSNIQNPIIEDIGVAQRGDYILTISKDGCTATASVGVSITELVRFSLYPNPNKGTFTIKGNLATDQVVKFDITDAVGRSLYRDEVKSFRKHFTKTIAMPVVPAAGMYMLRLDVAEKKSDLKFVIME